MSCTPPVSLSQDMVGDKEVDDRLWFRFLPALLHSDRERSAEDKTTASVSERITALNFKHQQQVPLHAT